MIDLCGAAALSDPPVDFRECGLELVHTPGSIQAYGVLAALDDHDLTITHLSGNTEERLGRYPHELLGASVTKLIGIVGTAFLSEELPGLVLGARPRRAIRQAVRGQTQIFSLSAHRWDGRLIVELEPEPTAEAGEPAAVSGEARTALSEAADLYQVARAAVHELRRLTGGERVVVYRLLGDEGGEVIAEERSPVMTPFLGLRFPPHDLPPSAQRLHQLIGVRLIPDANGYPAEILTAPGRETERPLDLSFAQLRGVSRFCTQYYRNIRVAGSLTTAIVVDGAFWGMVSCHDQVSRPRPWAVREAAAELGVLVGQAVARLAQEEESRQARRRDRVLGIVSSRLYSPDNALTGLITGQPRLNWLVGASGLAMVSVTAVFRRGWAPPAGDLVALARWLASGAVAGEDGVFSSDHLTAVYPAAEAWQSVAAGILAAVFSREPLGVLMCFRPELRHEVLWGGDPGRPAVADENRRLSPRSSFERWREEVRGRCRPWGSADRAVMGTLVAQRDTLGPGQTCATDGVTAAIRECGAWFENERMFRDEMLDLVSECMVLAVHCEPEGRSTTVAVNNRFCDLFRLDMFELVGGDARTIFRRVGLPVELLDQSRQDAPVELEVWSEVIGLRSVRVTREVVAETTGGPGDAVLMLVRIQDITEFKRSADSLRTAHEQARASERTKTQIIAGMSHELRSPLNAIIGFSEAIKSEIAGPVGVAAYRGYASSIYQSGYHLLGLITDLLDLATIDAGRRLLKEEEFNLTETMRDVFQWVNIQFADKSLGWTLDLAEAPILVKGDSSAVRQAIINLLTNAGKYTRAGGRIFTRVIDVPRRDIIITVEDTGIGIKPVDIARLFQLFERGSDPQVSEVGGTGLGLAITKALIELHGGSIELISDGHSGTTARMVIPGWRRVTPF